MIDSMVRGSRLRSSAWSAVAIAIHALGCRGVLGLEDKSLVDGGAGEGGSSAASDGAGAGGCASDVASDPSNCGRCGHDCLGGACTDGACAPTHFTFAAGPTTLALSAGTVVWSDYFSFYVRSLSKDRAEARSLAHFDEWHRPVGVAVVGDHAYFTVYNPLDVSEEGPGWLGRAPLAGGVPAMLVEVPYGPWGLATDEQAVYFTSRWGGAAVTRVSLDGAQIQEIVPDRGPGSQPLAVAVDATHAYVTSYGAGTIERVPKEGGDVETLATGQESVGPIVVDASSLVWATNLGIFTAPKDDPASATQISPTVATALTLLGDDVYFTSTSSFGRVHRDGTGEESLLTGLLIGCAVATDGEAVYFADQFGGTIGRYVP